MAWFRVCLSEEEQRIVGEERREHPHEPTRRKMEVLWLLHHGLTREKAAQIAGFGVATVTCLSQLRTKHRKRLKTLMTLNFQTFENVSLFSA